MNSAWTQPANDQFCEEIYLAGERVPPGTYRQIGAPREIVLESEDFLPASLDGRVACYVTVSNRWDQLAPGPQRRCA